MNVFKSFIKIFYKKKNPSISVYDLILKARKEYARRIIRGLPTGMCYCFFSVIEDFYFDCTKLDLIPHYYIFKKFIPEFNSNTFFPGTDIKETELWWPLDDIDSREDAFDLLLSIYKDRKDKITISDLQKEIIKENSYGKRIV